MGDTIASAKTDYLRLLNENNIISDSDLQNSDVQTETKGEETTGAITAINTAVVNGNSVYYIQIGEKIYKVDIEVSDRLPFLKAGDTITIIAEDNTIKNLK